MLHSSFRDSTHLMAQECDEQHGLSFRLIFHHRQRENNSSIGHHQVLYELGIVDCIPALHEDNVGENGSH
jgi:hypothetical protein